MTRLCQWDIVRSSLVSWSRRTNLDAHYDISGPSIDGDDNGESVLYNCMKSDPNRVFKRLDLDASSQTEPRGVSCRDLWMQKLRWSLLGYEYLWTQKVYSDPLVDSPITSDIVDLSRAIVDSLRDFIGYQSEYQPQVGIVNYYRRGETLTAHVDRSEENAEAPLVSFNVGLSCVFLVGDGQSLDVEPDALLLESGDVVVMCGAARGAYHGVPRILDDSCLGDCDDDIVEEVFKGDLRDMKYCKEFIKDARINFNLRQVFY
eukprot:Partr_v1_DN26649_c2_g1_i2_m69478 putative AlkB, alkylation repair homolog 1 (E. coli)